MSVDPPGPPAPDGADPTVALGDAGRATPAGSVKAGRAAGPKRTPRPTPSPNGKARRRADHKATPAPAPAAVGASVAAATASTTVAERPAGFAGPSAPSVPTASTEVADAPVGDPISPAPTAAPAPAPPAGRRPAPKRKARRRGRRVKRVVRRIDLWSVLKLSLVVYTCLYAVVLASLAVLWSVAYETETIDKITSFLADVGMENFHFYGDQMFRAAAAIGAVGVIAGTVITVLATALVNVISEMTGGIRLVVIEEDVQA